MAVTYPPPPPSGILSRYPPPCIMHQMGEDLFPDAWSGLSNTQVQQVACALSASDYVDWRRFILCISELWPWPTAKELARTSQLLKDVTQSRALTHEQFMKVPLTWLADGGSADSEQHWKEVSAMHCTPS